MSLQTKKTVLITGCSSGFGKAAAEVFAQDGWNVIATMRDPQKVTLPLGENLMVTRLDVQDPSSIESAIQAGLHRFGRIDALINNAGFGAFGLFESISRDRVLEQFQVNVFGAMDVTRAILPHFRENRGGIIVNVSSGAGVIGFPLASIYSASKFALEGFSEALSYELSSQGILVKIVEPGGVLETGFGARMGAEMAGNRSLPDYDSFVARASGQSDNHRSMTMASQADIARCLFNAVTDGKDTLRYTPSPDIAPLLDARRSGGDERYLELVRTIFPWGQ